jgi:tetratricopeptide (TPR) repeat protein
MWAALAIAAVASAQQGLPPKEDNLPPAEGQRSADQLPPDQLPPEEDKSKIQEQYTFNPLRSKKDISIGEFYFKKGDFKAAAGRFREATKWNDGNAEAWLRLGDAEEKMKDLKAAQQAWEKYLQLAPEAKNAGEVRKKVERLK